MNEESWVSVIEVVRHLGVTQDSIYRWIERRRFPANRVGRLWRFRLSEVDVWVRAQSKDAGDVDVETRRPPIEPSKIFRPFQYLGSKLRSLDAIAGRVSSYAHGGAHVV